MTSIALIERRAEFVYNAGKLAAKAANAPIVPASWDMRLPEFREQFREVIERQCGEERLPAVALHALWVESYRDMGWVYGAEHDPEKKTHPDMVPYAQLGQLERDKDDVFVALCEIARLWIYE